MVNASWDVHLRAAPPAAVNGTYAESLTGWPGRSSLSRPRTAANGRE